MALQHTSAKHTVFLPTSDGVARALGVDPTSVRLPDSADEQWPSTMSNDVSDQPSWGQGDLRVLTEDELTYSGGPKATPEEIPSPTFVFVLRTTVDRTIDVTLRTIQRQWSMRQRFYGRILSMLRLFTIVIETERMKIKVDPESNVLDSMRREISGGHTGTTIPGRMSSTHGISRHDRHSDYRRWTYPALEQQREQANLQARQGEWQNRRYCGPCLEEYHSQFWVWNRMCSTCHTFLCSTHGTEVITPVYSQEPGPQGEWFFSGETTRILCAQCLIQNEANRKDEQRTYLNIVPDTL
eukprot:6089803-Amphidinium_carterae.1